MIWSLAFWKGACERAIKTAAQVLAAIFVVGVPIGAVDIVLGLQLTATAVAASLLTSILSADFVAGPPDGAVFPLNAYVSVGTTMDAPRVGGPVKVEMGAGGKPYLAPIIPGAAVEPEPEGGKLSPEQRREAKLARARGEL